MISDTKKNFLGIVTKELLFFYCKEKNFVPNKKKCRRKKMFCPFVEKTFSWG